MASTLPSPELSGGAASPANIPPKPQRVLACVLCQQRKVKCDRRFPCANCTKAGAQCVPAALIPRQRRRRFPERDLLERVRHYESLLREYHIPFEPLHGKPTDAAPDPENHVHQDRDHNQDTGDRPVHEFERQDGAEVTEFRPANFWHAMNRRVSPKAFSYHCRTNDAGSHKTRTTTTAMKVTQTPATMRRFMFSEKKS